MNCTLVWIHDSNFKSWTESNLRCLLWKSNGTENNLDHGFHGCVWTFAERKNRVFNNSITGSNNQFQNYESRINFHELFKELHHFDETGKKDWLVKNYWKFRIANFEIVVGTGEQDVEFDF